MKATQHFTSASVSMTKYCNKCERMTAHRVNGNHKAGSCLVCLYSLDPRILSQDELTVMGIGRTQLQTDIWRWQVAREKRSNAPKQESLFA